jgi:hypothetical protein
MSSDSDAQSAIVLLDSNTVSSADVVVMTYFVSGRSAVKSV